MITFRRSEARGVAEHGWLKSFHTFSFANYYDPEHMGFRTLRVINEDYIQAGQGFGTHPHQNMEIITYVLSGALAHKDSMGNGSVILPGDVQYMSAGTGVTHSEFSEVRPGKPEMTHLLQIWILPSEEGLTPRYDQKSFSREDKLGKLKLVVSGDGRADSITIRQDVSLFASILQPGQSVNYELQSNRHAWLQLITGEIDLSGKILKSGDAAAISQEKSISASAKIPSEFLLFDLN
jgi:redox-sensitive bicupin YhaK (pirin superfamily)